MFIPEIGYVELAISLFPITIVAIIFFRWSLPLTDLIVASIRMVFQLIVIGFVLLYLFNLNQWWLGLLIMLFMLLVSGWISLRPLQDKTFSHFLQIAIGLFIGCGIILALILLGALQLEPWYQPRFVIPLAGMLLANTMNCISIAGERLDNELASEVEGYSATKARNAAFNTAMIPQINSLFAVGLVALPGMMTGQILSGISPLVAVRYQIIIMAAILCSATFSVAIYLSLRLKNSLLK